MTPAEIAPKDRLIVALDVPAVSEDRALIDKLEGVVSFFKVGLWLQFAAGFDGLLDYLIAKNKNIFLDAKMFDIGETVSQGVARAAERGGRQQEHEERQDPGRLRELEERVVAIAEYVIHIEGDAAELDRGAA